MNNASRKIVFTYEDKNYELTYTAHSLKQMERIGVDIMTLDSRPLTAPEDMFCGAFIANHNDVPYEKRLEIFKAIDLQSEEKEALGAELATMIKEAVEEIGTHSGNIKWRVTR